MLTAVICVAWVMGCADPNDTSFKGNLIIKVVDAPASLQALNVVFSRVSIHRAGLSDDLGWRIVSEDIVTQDILRLRNGQSRNLVSTTIPEGTYDRIRIRFNISSLQQLGVESTVFIPEQLAGGVDFEHAFEVREGATTGITMDFDATRSVKLNTQDRYELWPVVRIQNTDLAGSIIGGIVPDSVIAMISTTVSSDSVTTLSLGQAGNNSFELVDLPEGSYSVTIIPEDPAFQDTTFANVVVVRRQKTNIGAVPLRSR